MVHVQLCNSEAGFCKSKGHLESPETVTQKQKEIRSRAKPPAPIPPKKDQQIQRQDNAWGEGMESKRTWSPCEVPQGRGLVEVKTGNIKRLPNTAGAQYQEENKVTSHHLKEHCTQVQAEELLCISIPALQIVLPLLFF